MKQEIELIKCEIKRAPDPQVFHVVELKTGSKKLVAYGRLFPLHSTKIFVKNLEREYFLEVTNAMEFFRGVKKDIKENKTQ